MKLHEVISYSNYRDELLSLVDNALHDTVASIGEIFYQQYSNQKLISYDDFYLFLDKTLLRILKNNIIKKFRYFTKHILNMELADTLEIQFSKNLTVPGQASNTEILLNIDLLDAILENLKNSITQELFNQNDFDETNTIHNIQRAYKTIKSIKFKSPIYKISNSVAKLIYVFIHELVHMQQDLKQNKQSKEYRSYLTNDQQIFNKAIDSIMSGKRDKNDLKLYLSSPQEISAYANEAVLYILHELIEDNINYASIEDIKFYLKRLSIFIKNGNFMKEEYYSSIMANYASYFDKTNYSEYKIFKRFYKLVGKLLLNYRDNLKQLLDKKQELQ